jgi:phage shock protein A
MSQQGIVGRVMQLARANINATIDSAEDPEKMLDQLVRDYSAHISAAEQAIAQTIANLRMLEEDQKEDAKAAQQWGRKAQAASKKADELRGAGDKKEADTFDDLARVALERQLTSESDVVTIQHTIDAQNESIGKLKGGLDQMKIKLTDLKRKRSSLITRARSVQAQSRLQQAATSIDIMDPSSDVGRFEERIRREEARVRGHEELEASSIDAQFAGLDDDHNKSEIESRLRALKTGRAAAAKKTTTRPAAKAAASRH